MLFNTVDCCLCLLSVVHWIHFNPPPFWVVVYSFVHFESCNPVIRPRLVSFTPNGGSILQHCNIFRFVWQARWFTAMNMVAITDDVMCDVWWWRRPEGSWPMARIHSEQQAMGQVNVIDGRWVGGRQYSTAGGLVVWCCGRGEVDECGRHGWMRLPCCLLGEEAVGVLCRYRSTYPTNSYVRTLPFLSSKIFINTNSTHCVPSSPLGLR